MPVSRSSNPAVCQQIVKPDGLAALRQTREARDSMWQGIRLPASAGRRTIN